MLRVCGLTLAALRLDAQFSRSSRRSRSSVNLVDVDVTVTDAEGNFVTGLTPEDFEVFEDGKPQQVADIFVHRASRRAPGALRVHGGRPVRRATNRDVSSGRVYIIVLDDLNVAPLRTGYRAPAARASSSSSTSVPTTSPPSWPRADGRMRRRNSRATRRCSCGPSTASSASACNRPEMQRIDDYYQSQRCRVSISRADRPRAKQAVPNLLTRMQSFDPSNLERGQRAVGVLNTMRSLAEFLEGVRGRRKALLWFSEGIDYPMAEVFSSQSGTRSRRRRATRSTRPRGPTSTSTRWIRAASSA